MSDGSTIFPSARPPPPVAAGAALPYFPGLEVVAEISQGMGGMGVVYKAKEPTLDRMVAVKTLRADRNSLVVRNFFLREAPAAAQLDHPNILRIHRFSPEHNPPFFVMQYVDGRPLDQACVDRDFISIATMLEKIARALAYAHAHGIVHRDIKPANILVDHEDEPHVADFGLAHRLDRLDAGEASTVGTPICMAPELWQDPTSISGRADIYSLGVTMYRLLTGKYPFHRVTLKALKRAVLHRQPVMPQEIKPAIPEPLQRICLKAMERDPEHRYESAKEMAEDLRRFREGREVYARPTRYQAELRGKLRNHLTNLQLWHHQRLLDDRDYDRLRRPVSAMLEGPYPFHALSRRFPWETILLRVGCWMVVVVSVLWASSNYWDQLSRAQRILAEGIPMFVTTAVGWAVRAKGSRINSLILLAIGALLLPLFSSVVLVQMEWLEGLQTDQREVFARYMDRDANGRRLDSGMLSPTNLQIAVATGITVAYCLVLVRVTRALVAWAGIAVYLFYSAVLLRLGLKEWLMHEHVARALVAYLPLTLAFGIGGVLLRRWSKRDWLGAVTFAFFPFPAVACLSALAWFGAVEWLHVAADRKEPVINLLWMLDGVIYFVVALLFCRSRIGFVRFWGPLLMLVVSAHLSGPPNQRFNQDGLFMLGQAEVTFWELLALLVALMLAVVGTWLRLHTLAIPGLVSMVIFLLQATWRHFDHALAWPVALLAIGGSAMVISAILLVWRSRRAHEAIM